MRSLRNAGSAWDKHVRLSPRCAGIALLLQRCPSRHVPSGSSICLVFACHRFLAAVLGEERHPSALISGFAVLARRTHHHAPSVSPRPLDLFTSHRCIRPGVGCRRRDLYGLMRREAREARADSWAREGKAQFGRVIVATTRGVSPSARHVRRAAHSNWQRERFDGRRVPNGTIGTCQVTADQLR